MKIDKLTLEQFNNKNSLAFANVYNKLYNDLFYFTNKVYQNFPEIESCDIVHDLFIKIWKNNNAKFTDINGLKGYCFIAIKNGFKNHLGKAKSADNYIKEIDNDDLLITYIAETDFISTVSKAIDILPNECSKVFQLYLDGYTIKEIAEN